MRYTLLLLLLVAFAPADVGATTCAPDGGSRAQVRAAFDAPSVVFSAYVLDVSGESDDAIAELKVLQVWKGELEVGQIIKATAGESVRFMSDGVVPTPGTALLVYSSSTEPFMLHTCSRTRELDSATGDIPLLNNLSNKRRYRLGGA
jgi:hypothetical protein